jgi:hypothetical protein
LTAICGEKISLVVSPLASWDVDRRIWQKDAAAARETTTM